MSVKRSQKQLSRKRTFALFYNLIALTLGLNSAKGLTLSKIIEEINFQGVWDELGSRKVFQRQSVTKYLRLTLVSIKNRAPREKLSCYFSGLFC